MADFNFVYDPVKGESALARLADTLARVEPSELLKSKPKVDLGRVAIAVLAAAACASRPEVRQTFASLPSSLFDMSHVDILPDLGWAAWHTQSRYAELVASERKLKMPPDLAQRVSERKQRMLRVAEYHLGDNPTEMPVLRAIRRGSGRCDSAADLFKLAALYRTHKDILSTDTKWYREDDAREAELDVASLLCILGKRDESETKSVLELLTRIYVCTLKSYGEVRAAACFAFRNNHLILAKFPALHTAVCGAWKSTAKKGRSPVSSVVPTVDPSAPLEVPSDEAGQNTHRAEGLAAEQ
jgi:hypothetical protein